MKARNASFRSIALTVAVSLAFLLSGTAQSHPQLQGTWTTDANFNGFGSFALGDTLVVSAPGQWVGPGYRHGAWQWMFINYRNNGYVFGTYTLCLWNPYEGVCTFQSGRLWETGHIHLGTGKMVFGSQPYIRNR
jgi:hypothetical protein